MKKHILIIMPRPPFPLCSGGDHAQFHFIGELLNRMNVSVCFEVNDQNYRGYTELLEIWKGVTFYPVFNLRQKSTLIDWYRQLKMFIGNIKKRILLMLGPELSRIEDTVKYQSFINLPIFPKNAGYINLLAEILGKNKFDVIQIEFISLAPLVYILPDDAIKILVHHEIRYIRILREMDLFKKVEAFDRCRFGVIKDEEIAILRKFNKIITLTETDKEILSEDIDPGKIYVSPATIPVTKMNSRTFVPFKNKLVFIGSSGHLPNTDGIGWFIEEILPGVEKEIPGIKLEIIGRWEPQYRRKYQRKNIVFSGFIEDLGTVLPSSLLIVPIRIGSGMRLKIIEAVNLKIPFVTTTIGVEGLNFENNKECIIADNAGDFVKGICSLTDQGSLQQQMVVNASLKLITEFSFEIAIQKRLDFYNQIS